MPSARPTADMVGICVVEFVLPILHTPPIFSTIAEELSGRSDSNALAHCTDKGESTRYCTGKPALARNKPCSWQ